MRRGIKGIVFCLAFGILILGLPSVKAGAKEVVRIDTSRKYKGMNASFAKGYQPTIRKNTMQLVIPFLAEGLAKEERLLVRISFEREENSPFSFQNYEKAVRRTKKGVYLYKCKVCLKKERVNGQYPLHILVRPQSDGEAEWQDFTIYVEITDAKPAQSGGEADAEGKSLDGMGQSEGKAAESKEEIWHQPKVMLVKNSLQGEDLQAGSETSWELSAQNCSGSQEILNLKVTLISESVDLLFEKNAWYFARIGANGVIDLSQTVGVRKKAVPESVAVQLQFDYEDAKGTAYQITEALRLSISQMQQAELVDFSMPEGIYEADTEAVAFQVQNTGLAVIYNARVRIEGRGLFAKECFLGNIEAGTAKDGELSVFAGTLDMDGEGEVSDASAEKYGDVAGTVIFSYENELGEVTEQAQEFRTTIKKPQIVELQIEEEVEQTNQWRITAMAAVFLVLLLAIVWLCLRMRGYQEMRRELYGKTKSS